MKSLLLLVCFAFGATAQAKCELDQYTISGEVLAASGGAVGGAKVNAHWLQHGKDAELFVQSEKDGSYSLQIPFDPVSPSEGGDDGMYGCHAKLRVVHMSAYSPGLPVAVATINEPSLNTSSNISFDARVERNTGD